MMRKLAIVSAVALGVLGAPALAQANDDDHEGDHRDPPSGHHGGAPEPLTAIGLALGAGGIAAARWASRRKSNPKQ